MALECEDPWTSCVDTKRKFLNQELDVDDELLYSLMSKSLTNGKKLLLQEDKESIECRDSAGVSSPTNGAKVDQLIRKLRFKGPKHETFNLFCTSLVETKREWIRSKLLGVGESEQDRRRGTHSAPVKPLQLTDGFSLVLLPIQSSPYQNGSSRSSRSEGFVRQKQFAPAQFSAQISKYNSHQTFAFQFEKKDDHDAALDHSSGFAFSGDSYEKGLTHHSSNSRARAPSTDGSDPLPPEFHDDNPKQEIEQLKYRCHQLEQQLLDKSFKLERVERELAHMFDDMGDRREERKKLENDNSFKNKRIVELEKIDCDWRNFYQSLQSLAMQHESTIKGLTITIDKQNSEIKELHQKISEISGSSTGMGLSSDPSDSDAASAKEYTN